MDKIIIRNAYEHNLKHLSLEIPLGAFTCVTGCSGCGKSSLVYDTIYAESQRGFLEGMSGNLYGQKLMNKPKVDSIENLHPALNISQNYYNVNPRSTIGTITEIAYYLRSLFAVVNSDQAHEVPESAFSSNNPKSFCPNCNGLGVENVVSEELLIPDKEKTLREGAILFFKGSSESKEQKYLAALCEHYCISVDKKVSELSKEELDHLLYSDDNIRYKLSYKEGKRKKQHYVFLRGAVAAIQDRLATSDSSEQSAVYARYMEETPCHVCGGSGKRVAPLMEAGFNAFSCDYAVDLEQALQDADGKMVIYGNINPAGALLFDTPEDVYAEAAERIKTAAGRGYIMAPGCDMVCDAPFENVMAMPKACKDLA